VQGRNKVVGFHADVEEAPDDVHNVVCVNGGKHQVAGKGSVDSDLRSFSVADFADHDLVGIVTQDGTQTTGKCQALFLINGNLHNAANLVLDRVFDGDELVFFALDLIQSGVQGGRLAGAGRPGDQ